MVRFGQGKWEGEGLGVWDDGSRAKVVVEAVAVSGCRARSESSPDEYSLSTRKSLCEGGALM